MLRFFGQKIFDHQEQCVGVELLIRDVPFGENTIRSPAEVMQHPDFDSHDLYAIDMQLLSNLSLFASQFKKTSCNYVFINLSDRMLLSLAIGDESTSPYCNLKSISRMYAPLKIVIEVSENSRIRKEHLTIIVDRLKKIGFLVAQDDYTSHRAGFLTIDWNFVKIDLDSCPWCDIPKNKNLVIERSNNHTIATFPEKAFHQGFEFHYPEDLLEFFGKSSQKDIPSPFPKVIPLR